MFVSSVHDDPMTVHICPGLESIDGKPAPEKKASATEHGSLNRHVGQVPVDSSGNTYNFIDTFVMDNRRCSHPSVNQHVEKKPVRHGTACSGKLYLRAGISSTVLYRQGL